MAGEAASPLVLDLGCGFGVGLLSLVQPALPSRVQPELQPELQPGTISRRQPLPSPPAVNGPALPAVNGLPSPAVNGLPSPAVNGLSSPAVNVLGCDACALKVRCDLKLQPLAVHLLTIASAMCFTRHLHPLAAYLLTIASTMCFTRPLCASRDTCSLLILLATVYSKRATLRVVPLHLVRARVHFRWATRAVSRRAGVSEIRHASSVRLQKRR